LERIKLESGEVDVLSLAKKLRLGEVLVKRGSEAVREFADKLKKLC
jgi:hypothetical protein